MNMLYTIILMIVSTFIGSIGSLFLKKCSNKFSLNPLKIIKDKYLIMGVIAYGVSTLVYIFLLKTTSLNILYPLTAFGYIWILLLSKKYLNEQMNTYKWTGIALIVLGITLIVH